MKKIKLLFMSLLSFFVMMTSVNAYTALSHADYSTCMANSSGYEYIAEARGNLDYIYCKRAACNNGKYTLVDQRSNNGYGCANKNPQPYITVLDDGCASYTGKCSANEGAYCTRYINVDCNRTVDGKPYIKPTVPTTTTTTTTTSTTTTTTKTPTKATTKATTKKVTTTTTTTTTTQPVTENPDDSNLNLKYIKVDGKDLVGYDNTIDNYTVEIPFGVSEVKIEVEPEVNSTIYAVYGNFDMPDEDTTITIKVISKNNKERTITLSVTRYLVLDSDCTLSKLSVKEDSFKFKPNKKDYKIRIDKKYKKINVSAKTNKETSTLEIKGADKVKNNSVVEVLVTAEDGSVCKYTIKVKTGINPFLLILIILLIVGAGCVGGYFALNNIKKAKGKYKYE